ncbi:MAG: SigE family RNA polymerase sigma factor [Actinomycetota bacterium]|nr:SigE family RNA polymerase sigma factor [Actinomycetota bacterium]
MEHDSTAKVAGWANVRRPSLAELYRTHSPGALRLAYVLVGDDNTAQDVVHEAFLRLFGRYRELRDPDHFDAYLRRTIINLSKNHYRKVSNERSALERTDRQPLHTQQHDPSDLVQLLKRLPERQRAAMALRYLEDLSEQQTADVMDTTVAAVKSLTQRGTAAIREHLRGEGDE